MPSGFHDAFATEPVTLHRLGVEFSPRELFGVHRDEWDRYGTGLGAMRMTRWMVRYGLLDHLDSIYDSLASVADRADLVLTHNVLVPRAMDRRAAPHSVCDAPRGADRGAERGTPPRDAADAGDPGSGRPAESIGSRGPGRCAQWSSSSRPNGRSASDAAVWACPSIATSS